MLVKKGFAAIISLTCFCFAIPAYGATTGSQPSMFKTEIDIPGTPSTHPYAFVKSGTVYMPVWYVMNALGKLGISTVWNGHDWKMSVPSKFTIDVSHIHSGTGSIHLYLNGTLIEAVDGIVTADPSSGEKTTYLPIWYVMQTLERTKMTSNWNGNTWSFQVPGGSADGGPGVVPQPPLPANEIAKYAFLAKLMPFIGVAPDSTGQSPYDDIGTSDVFWGYVHSAIEHHLMDPDSATHSGAYEALTLSQADEIYWNALGMGHSSYQPGNDGYDWGNAIQLNPRNESASSIVSPTDEQILLSHIADFGKGYIQTENGYQVLYRPEDEYQATFSVAVNSSTGESYFPNTADAVQAINQTYQFFDHTTFQINGTDLIVTIPNLADTNWFAYATTTGQVEYSIDGGKTYTQEDAFDSRNLAAISLSSTTEIKLKVNAENGLCLSMNQLLPAFGGTCSLGQVTISDNDGTVSVVRTNLNP